MKILGLDYGTNRVGVALSYASLAQPLLILDNDDQLLSKLQALIAQHRVGKIVLGVSENVMARLTKEFACRLEKIVDLPIILVDETLSSYQVHQFLKTSSLKKRSGFIDHFAAAIILQNFLDEQNT